MKIKITRNQRVQIIQDLESRRQLPRDDQERICRSKTLHVSFDYFGAPWSEESYRNGDLICALCEKIVEFNRCSLTGIRAKKSGVHF